MSDDVRLELRDEGALWLTFDRAKARNAMTYAMYEAIEAAAKRANEDAAVRALVLTGAGASFIAGTDISQFADLRTAEQAYGHEDFMERILGALEAVRKPTIAAIGGATTGGGLAVAASCDLRIATSSGPSTPVDCWRLARRSPKSGRSSTFAACSSKPTICR
jgi:enoyl-CoA hydratase/carnithine racemase